ncbi:hypothetical protein [Vibrio harveyi]|uniref:hypothetical protein n=1 Tax=Vibrio harveyi TaxID=669 RepID=UPI00238079A0|nr:hypothetical protein [Vibrio harveyi]
MKLIKDTNQILEAFFQSSITKKELDIFNDIASMAERENIDTLYIPLAKLRKHNAVKHLTLKSGNYCVILQKLVENGFMERIGEKYKLNYMIKK